MNKDQDNKSRVDIQFTNQTIDKENYIQAKKDLFKSYHLI